MYPRHSLTQVRVSGDVLAWQLHRDGRFLDLHEDFRQETPDGDAAAAMDWAEGIIGARQEWRHAWEGEEKCWTAGRGPHDGGSARGVVGADVLRGLEPGTLVVAVGPGGAGKSTVAAAAAEAAAVVCLDSLREEISGDAGDQSVTPAAVERQDALLEEFLSAGTTVFVDSTNVELWVRVGLVERARCHGRPAVALRVFPHLDTCRARNRARPVSRRVRDDVLVWQYSLARAATPLALIGEGFAAAHDIVTPL